MAANWRKLINRHLAQQRIGLEQGAAVIQAAMVATDAYQGMSGATRASSIAYVATPDDTGDSEIEAAYNAAAGLLQGFTGHQGRPLLEDAPGPGQDEALIIGTVPTDYIINLEQDNAGERAFVADSLQQHAPEAFDAVVRATREAWR
jgi:hypothetical protein